MEQLDLEPLADRMLRKTKILHYTPLSHPDHPTLLHIKTYTEDINKKTNEVAREVESADRVEEITKLIDWEATGQVKITMTVSSSTERSSFC